jgi:hypothetical protein
LNRLSPGAYEEEQVVETPHRERERRKQAIAREGEWEERQEAHRQVKHQVPLELELVHSRKVQLRINLFPLQYANSRLNEFKLKLLISSVK